MNLLFILDWHCPPPPRQSSEDGFFGFKGRAGQGMFVTMLTFRTRGPKPLCVCLSLFSVKHMKELQGSQEMCHSQGCPL